MCILKYRIVLSCNGVYFEVSYRIVVYRHISVCILKLSLGDTSLTGIGIAIPVSRYRSGDTSLTGIGIQYQSHRYRYRNTCETGITDRYL